MNNQSFSEQVWNGLGDAITDIRQKVVEEPMWGRSLGENDAPSWPQARDVGQEREQQQDIDLDR